MWRSTVILSALAVSLLLAGCSKAPHTRVPNSRPHVRLTGGPVEGEAVLYTSEFFWSGWDDDGIIDRYQYAVDVPADMRDQIDDPYGRMVAWRDTATFRGRFLFRTPQPDSIVNPDGTSDFSGRFRGQHTFYVRSIDNEGLASRADFLTFTANNVVPQTTIVMPPAIDEAAYIKVGRQITVTWEGLDPDNPDPDHRPAFYEYKLIPMPDGRNPETFVLQYIIDVTPGPETPWTRVSAETTSVRLRLNPPQMYVFAVRAIDEAGGTESVFVKGRNAFTLDSSDANLTSPLLKVSERGAGSHTFPVDGEVWDIEVPSGQCFRFEFRGDASSYGGDIQCYDWGLDVADPESDREFHGCSLIDHNVDPICFERGGIHALTVKCRDSGGGTTIGTILIHVIPFVFDRPVLYVDDHRLPLGQGVTDAIMDGRAISMLVDAGIPLSDIDTLDVWGPGDRESAPYQVKLSDLARYRLVVWSCFGPGFSGESALSRGNLCSTGRVLQAYSGGGGSLWIYGQMVGGSFHRLSTTDCNPDLLYNDNDGIDYEETEFACDFLHLCQPGLRCERSTPRKDGLRRAVPDPGVGAELFPAMEIDSTVFPLAIGGVPLYDAQFQPIFEGGVEILYRSRTVSASKFDDRPIAWRYADPGPVPKQGPIVFLGFPLHYWKPGSAADRTGTHGLARSLLEWFRAHEGGTSP